MSSMWDEEQAELTEACERKGMTTPVWVDLLLLGIVLAVGSWLIYLILSVR